jgi:hypothetical protein
MTYFTEGEALAFAQKAGIRYVPLYSTGGVVWLFDSLHYGTVRADQLGVAENLVKDWFSVILDCVNLNGSSSPSS